MTLVSTLHSVLSEQTLLVAPPRLGNLVIPTSIPGFPFTFARPARERAQPFQQLLGRRRNLVALTAPVIPVKQLFASLLNVRCRAVPVRLQTHWGRGAGRS